MAAKIINVFLMDGDVNGIIKTSISNFTGLGYKIPRDMLDSAKAISQLSYSGVYFLFGQDCVYIGQAGIRKNGCGLLSRLTEHIKSPNKDFWTEAIVFTKSDDTMGSTELNYLENKFYNLALKANRYEVKNANDPTPGNITEEKQSEMDEFASYVELILGVLGYKVFTEPAPTRNKKNDNNTRVEKTNNGVIPMLPQRTSSTKVGAWIREAMRNLSNSGYIFSDETIMNMASPSWSEEHFGTSKPFIRICKDKKIEIKDVNGYTRYWSEIFVFGKYDVLVSKEWYEKHFEKFELWYNTLQ